jgi:hypothetical protein
MVDQLSLHFKFEGDILKKDSEEANDQETFWEDKKQAEQAILNSMNASIQNEHVSDPCKCVFTSRCGKCNGAEALTTQLVQLPGALGSNIQFAAQRARHQDGPAEPGPLYTRNNLVGNL